MFRILMILSLIPMVGHAAQTCHYHDSARPGEDFNLQVRFPANDPEVTEIVLEKGGVESVYKMTFTDYRITVGEANPGFEFNNFPGDFLILTLEPKGNYSLRLGQKMSPMPMMGKYMEYAVDCTQ